MMAAPARLDPQIIAPLAAPEPDALCAHLPRVCCDGAMTATAERLLWPPPGACARARTVGDARRRSWQAAGTRGIDLRNAGPR